MFDCNSERWDHDLLRLAAKEVRKPVKAQVEAVHEKFGPIAA
jgi:hypothetical protein